MTLDVKNLCFSYEKGKPVLIDVSFQAERGGVICAMGPNGSGKTTLLDCILGGNKLSSGSVKILGKPLEAYKRTELARHVACIPQLHAPSFPYTVREVVLMGRMAYAPPFGGPRAADEAACDEALRAAGLEDFAERPYTALSGGELRLVLLARAMCQRAGLILMDEPAAYLDFQNEMRFLENVVSMTRERGVTVLLATHSPNHGFYFEGNGVPTKVLLLSMGRVAGYGAPSRVVTEETVAAVFGVEARILGEGPTRTVAILRAL